MRKKDIIMVCEYYFERNGKAFCRAYGGLEKANEEKLSECKSNFAVCFQRAEQFLKDEKREEGLSSRMFNQ